MYVVVCNYCRGDLSIKTLKKRQQWIGLLLGILLLLTPLVFSIVTMSKHSWNVWLLGGCVGVVSIVLALLWLGMQRNATVEALTVLVGMVLVFIPGLLSESGLTLDGWASCILGNILVAGAGWLLFIRIVVIGPVSRGTYVSKERLYEKRKR